MSVDPAGYLILVPPPLVMAGMLGAVLLSSAWLRLLAVTAAVSAAVWTRGLLIELLWINREIDLCSDGTHPDLLDHHGTDPYCKLLRSSRAQHDGSDLRLDEKDANATFLDEKAPSQGRP